MEISGEREGRQKSGGGEREVLVRPMGISQMSMTTGWIDIPQTTGGKEFK